LNTSTNYGFNLPSKSGNDLADIDKISENFVDIDSILHITADKATSAESSANQATETANYARTEAENAVGAAQGANGRVDALALDVGDLREAVDSLASYMSQVGETLSEHTASIHNLGEQIGDIDTALDGIIAIQESLIGGASV
jgi:chromosome segregation ATPase